MYPSTTNPTHWSRPDRIGSQRLSSWTWSPNHRATQQNTLNITHGWEIGRQASLGAIGVALLDGLYLFPRIRFHGQTYRISLATT